MTTPNSTPQQVTIDRIVDTMRAEFDIELTRSPEHPVASANLNGLAATFAVIGTVAIIRAEADSEIPSGETDATWYLAANQLNSVALSARVVIVDHAETLIVRTERDLPIAAGMNDAQLGTALRHAVDAVLGSHDAVRAVAEDLEKRAHGTSE